MDPDADPGGPKAYGSYGSGPGSATLLSSVQMFNDGIYVRQYPPHVFTKNPAFAVRTVRWQNERGHGWLLKYQFSMTKNFGKEFGLEILHLIKICTTNT